MESPGTGMRNFPAAYVLRALDFCVPGLIDGGGGGAYGLVALAGRGCDGILSSTCMYYRIPVLVSCLAKDGPGDRDTSGDLAGTIQEPGDIPEGPLSPG